MTVNKRSRRMSTVGRMRKMRDGNFMLRIYMEAVRMMNIWLLKSRRRMGMKLERSRGRIGLGLMRGRGSREWR